MTLLAPVTKFMAHLPLAFCQHQPKSALNICLGMGTTFRSMISWGIPTTVIELCPGVKRAISYYHSDADSLLRNPKNQIIIDDGRRFLMRTNNLYDCISIDPPPPMEAAGSSLLYSVEFYRLAQKHLTDGGILQQWLPSSEHVVVNSAVSSIRAVFPYVKSFRSFEGWGIHLLASNEPFQNYSSAELVSHMPENAQRDLVEWFDTLDAKQAMQKMVQNEVATDSLIVGRWHCTLTDAKAYNEYFVLRRVFFWMRNFIHS